MTIYGIEMLKLKSNSILKGRQNIHNFIGHGGNYKLQLGLSF
jgi:hypothetical protein